MAMAGVVLTAGEPAPDANNKIISNAGTAPARTARSVHLHWTAPTCETFYNEVVVEKAVPGSYFMACGWQGGYFGIQELADGKKIALFSVWDSVGAGNNPNDVKEENRVEVLYRWDGTSGTRFGGEGTGQQCKKDWPWEIGQTNRFLLRASTENGKTTYAAFIYDSKNQQWFHMATFRRSASKSGGLNGLYSFIEDFRRNFTSATETRQATFQNGWVETKSNGWQPLREAKFTASNSPTEARDTINAGVNASGAGFFLATGGDTKQQTKLQSTIKRDAVPSGSAPKDLPSLQ